MPFISSVQGWVNQPSIIKLENLLSNQEAMMKQMSKKSSSQGGNYVSSMNTSGSTPITCYRCRKLRHLRRDCLLKVTCSWCGRSGHLKKNFRVTLTNDNANVIHAVEALDDEPEWE